jgi:hypothetical protein
MTPSCLLLGNLRHRHAIGAIGFISCPLRCGLGSALRLIGGGLSQFGPVFMPVYGAHFLTCNFASAERLNGFAVFSRYGFLTATHL